jgi:hypothetical protein
VAGGSELASAFAQAAAIPVVQTAGQMLGSLGSGDCLLVWEGLRDALHRADIGKWRSALQLFEQDYAVPLLAALADGKIAQITLDVLSEGASRRFVLTRAARWKLWRLPKPLLRYALVQHQA